MQRQPILAIAIRGTLLAFACLMMLPSLFFAMIGPILSDTVPTLWQRMQFPLLDGLCVSGFFYVGIAGRRLAQSRIRRWVASVLLAIPACCGIYLMQIRDDGLLRALSYLFLVAPTLVGVCTVWPLQLTRQEPDDSGSQSAMLTD